MGKSLTAISFVVVSCLTQIDLKNEVCRVLCRRDGFEVGKYYNNKASCVCGDLKSYKEITDKVITVRRLPGLTVKENNDVGY